jgi:hypothetical protein
LLSDHAAERQNRSIAIGLGECFPEMRQRNPLMWLQRARGGTGRDVVCRMLILRVEAVRGEVGSSRPASGVPEPRLWGAARRIDKAELQVYSVCVLCNRHKSDRTHAIDPETGAEVPLFHPRLQRWSEHFRWSGDGLRILGLTPTGRATVGALHLDSDPDALVVRSYWVLAGWHPPAD